MQHLCLSPHETLWDVILLQPSGSWIFPFTLAPRRTQGHISHGPEKLCMLFVQCITGQLCYEMPRCMWFGLRYNVTVNIIQYDPQWKNKNNNLHMEACPTVGEEIQTQIKQNAVFVCVLLWLSTDFPGSYFPDSHQCEIEMSPSSGELHSLQRNKQSGVQGN